jgi:hypothetical protein
MAKMSSALSGAATGAAAGASVGGPWGAVIGGGLGLAGGLMAGNEAEEAADRARKMYDAAMAQYANIDVPDTEKMKLYLQDMQSAGQLTPEMEQALLLGPSAMENIQVDPRLRQEQMRSLEGVSQAATQGMTDADMATLELIRRNSAAEAQAKSNQILQNMQQRGQGGSGAELIAQLQNAQSSADRENAQSLQEARQMQANKMAALQQLGSLSSGMRGQEFGEQSAVANARDIIEKANIQNQQSVGQRNVASKNAAQQANLANAQKIMDANALLHNQQQQYNKELLQRDYNNRLQIAQARANAMTGQASNLQGQAANIAGSWGQTLQGVGTVANAWAQNRREQQKTDALYPRQEKPQITTDQQVFKQPVQQQSFYQQPDRNSLYNEDIDSGSWDMAPAYQPRRNREEA